MDWEAWRFTIRTILGKQCLKHSFDIFMQLLCIQCDLKPSLLFDYAVVEPERFIEVWKTFESQWVEWAELEQKAKGNHGQTNTIADRGVSQILTVEDDVFLYNSTYLLKNITDMYIADLTSCAIIDISTSRNQPVLLEQAKTEDILKETHIFPSSGIVQQIEKHGQGCSPECDSVLHLELDDRLNRPTLFGALLGYPVLYWYQTIGEQTQGNCLNMVPLCVVKVKCKLSADLHSKLGVKCPEGSGVHTMYSFSFAAVFKDQLMGLVYKWYDQVKLRFSRQTMLTDLTFTLDTVTLPAVTL